MKLLEEYKKQGEKQGEKKGEIKKSREIAIKMLKENMEIALIIKLTDLSESEILELKKNKC